MLYYITSYYNTLGQHMLLISRQLYVHQISPSSISLKVLVQGCCHLKSESLTYITKWRLKVPFTLHCNTAA